jgi:hypothetical protein
LAGAAKLSSLMKKAFRGAMPSGGTIGGLVGKLDVLRIECPTCGRRRRLIERIDTECKSAIAITISRSSDDRRHIGDRRSPSIT